MARTEIKNWEQITKEDYPEITKENIDISEILNMVKELQKQIKENEKEKESLTIEYRKKIEERDNEWSEKLNQIQKNNLLKNIEAIDKKINIIEKNNRDDKQIISNYKTKLSAADKEIGELKGEITGLTKQVEELKEEMEKGFLQKQKEHLQKSLENIKSHLREWNEKCKIALTKFKENTKNDLSKSAHTILHDVEKDYLETKLKNKEKHIMAIDGIVQNGLKKNIQRQNKRIVFKTRLANARLIMQGKTPSKIPELKTEGKGIFALINKEIQKQQTKINEIRQDINKLEKGHQNFMENYENRKKEIEDINKTIVETEINKETGIANKDMKNIKNNIEKGDWEEVRDALLKAGFEEKDVDLRMEYMKRGMGEIETETKTQELGEKFKENISEEKFKQNIELEEKEDMDLELEEEL